MSSSGGASPAQSLSPRPPDPSEARASPDDAQAAPKLLHYALAVIAGAVFTALAAPPLALSPFALLALAPLSWAVTRAPSWRVALALGAASSALTTALVFHWVPGSVHAFFGLPMPVCWALFPLYGAVAQPQLVVWAVARWQWRELPGHGAMFASAALYAGLDWMLPKLFRDTLGVTFFADPWVIQVAELGGLYLLTFAAVLVGEVVSAVAAPRARRGRALGAALAAAALWGAILLYGAVRRGQLERVVAAAPSFSAGVVQANIGNVEKEIAAHGDLDGIVNTLRAYGQLSDQLVTELPAGTALPDLLVWPETAYPLAYGARRSTLDDDMDHELATYVRERKVPLLFGGYQRRGEVEFNSALLLDPQGGLAAYHKFHLIPFGEYIPLLGRAKFGTGGTPRVLELALPAAAAAPAQDGAAGSTARPARTIKIGPVVCYESLIPSHAIAAVEAGAQALINLTNDSWFLSVSEKELHLAMAAVRSVETRRAQLRATNTGISALILPTGEIIGRGPIDAAAALRFQVPILDEAPTLVMRLGTWTGPAGLIGCMLWLAVVGRRRRRAAR